MKKIIISGLMTLLIGSKIVQANANSFYISVAPYYATLKTSGLKADLPPPPIYTTQLTLGHYSISQGTPGMSIATGLQYLLASKVFGKNELELSALARVHDEFKPLFIDGTEDNAAKMNVQAGTLLMKQYIGYKLTSNINAALFAGLGESGIFNSTMLINQANRNPSTQSLSNRQFHFAWSTGAEISFQTTKRTQFLLGYRYVNFGPFTSKKLVDENGDATSLHFNSLYANEIYIGLKF